MSQVFVRSEQLTEKIYDIKLHIPEWKVLFAMDGRMTVKQIIDFLEMEDEDVNKAINRLQEMTLIALEGGEVAEPETKVTSDEIKGVEFPQEFEIVESGEEKDEKFTFEPGVEEFPAPESDAEPGEPEEEFTAEPVEPPVAEPEEKEASFDIKAPADELTEQDEITEQLEEEIGEGYEELKLEEETDG